MKNSLRAAFAALALVSLAAPALAEPSRVPDAQPGSSVAAAKDVEPTLTVQLQERFALVRSQERDLQGSLQKLLDEVLGAGRAVVRVKLELDFDHRTQHNRLLAPVTFNGKLVVAQHGAATPAHAATETSALNQQDEDIRHEAGNIRRMSIAVAIPADLGAAGETKIRELVAAAAGSDDARRDVVSVVRVEGLGASRHPASTPPSPAAQ